MSFITEIRPVVSVSSLLLSLNHGHGTLVQIDWSGNGRKTVKCDRYRLPLDGPSAFPKYSKIPILYFCTELKLPLQGGFR